MKTIKIIVGLIATALISRLFVSYPFEAGVISLLLVMAWVAVTPER